VHNSVQELIRSVRSTSCWTVARTLSRAMASMTHYAPGTLPVTGRREK
jgi:hypothetical protein